MFAGRTKGRVHYYDTFNEQQKCHVTKFTHAKEKTKVSYYITFFQTLLKMFFLCLCYDEIETSMNKLNTEQFSRSGRRTDASSHENKMFLNGKAIADGLPNIHFSLTTVRDASLPGIQTYFIYSASRIIGKPSLISIEKFGF